MAPRGAFTGQVRQADNPSWSSLELVLGADLPGWFMWMYELRLDDGTRVDAFKHRTTRRYLHLASGGRAFAYRVDCSYCPVDLATALAVAFVGWERADPPPQQRRQLASAITSARDLAA